jgi:PAS domain S-box-containing protein
VDYYAPDDSQLLLKPEQFLGRTMHDVLPPWLAARFSEQFARLTAASAPAIVEYTLPIGGTDSHYEARLVPCGSDHVLTIVRDVTQSRRAEAELQKSQERYRLATAAASVGVWDWHLATNELYVDPSIKAILGYQPQEVPDNLDGWLALVHPDDVHRNMNRVQEHIENRTPYFESEYRIFHRDTSVRWLVSRGSAVFHNGEAVRMVGTTTDITDRKASEYALHDAQAELARVSRLTALGEFAASIAHEVRQPLTVIMLNAKTCLRWLNNDTHDPGELRAALRDLADASRQANDVIQRNRELFRHHTVQKQPLEINEVIRDVLALSKTRLESSHVWLGALLPQGLPPVEGDRVELQQVLLNLIANSIDATEQIDPDSRCIRVVTTLTAEGMVQVSVSDNGVGFGAVDMDRMFTSSYTTKPNGTGVGLSLSRSIVEAHGGRLWAQQNRDRGATFYFTVPICPAMAVA